MPDGLIITFILKVLSLCWVVCACVLLFFFSSRDEKRDVLIVLPNHSDGLQARDFCVTQWHTEMVLIFFPPIRKWVAAVELGVVKSGTNTSFLKEIFMHIGEREENIAMPFCEMSHSCFPLTSFP